jgi:hypothetical protein
MDEIVRAIADHDGGIVDWHVDAPLSLLDDINPLCTAVDHFLLDRPGYKVTISITRRPGVEAPVPGLLTGDAAG